MTAPQERHRPAARRRLRPGASARSSSSRARSAFSTRSSGFAGCTWRSASALRRGRGGVGLHAGARGREPLGRAQRLAAPRSPHRLRGAGAGHCPLRARLPRSWSGARGALPGALPPPGRPPPGALGARFVLAFVAPSPAHVPDGGEPARDGRGRRRAARASSRDGSPGSTRSNTVGGVAGTLVAGFFLIEHLGITRSLYVGAAGSALVAAAAFALARLVAHERSSGPAAGRRGRPPSGAADSHAASSDRRSVTGSRPRPRSSPGPSRSRPRSSGPAPSSSSSTTRPTPSAPSWPCTCSASPPAPSSRPASRAPGRAPPMRSGGDARRELARSRWGRSPSTATCPSSRRSWPPGRPRSRRARRRLSGRDVACASWGRALALIFGQVAAVLFLPALLLGAVFPLTLALAPASDGRRALVGRLYAVNAVGCVAGAVLGTFVLVALLGTRGALLLLAWLPVPIALWALREALPSQQGARGAAPGSSSRRWPAAACWPLPAASTGTSSRRRFGRVVWFSEGVSETVAVCEHEDGSRWIQFSDGRGASGTWSFQGGWLYAHLPLLLHPRPRSAAVICFGTGNTLGAASLHPLEALDGIELSRRGRQGGAPLRGDEPRRGHERPGPDRDRGRAQLPAGDRPALRRDHRGAAPRPHRGRRQPLLARLLRAVLAPPHRRRDHGGLARHLGAGDARDADARPRVRGRLPPRLPLGLHPPRRVAPHRLEEAAADRPRRARGADGRARRSPATSPGSTPTRAGSARRPTSSRST